MHPLSLILFIFVLISVCLVYLVAFFLTLVCSNLQLSLYLPLSSAPSCSHYILIFSIFTHSFSYKKQLYIFSFVRTCTWLQIGMVSRMHIYHILLEMNVIALVVSYLHKFVIFIYIFFFVLYIISVVSSYLVSYLVHRQYSAVVSSYTIRSVLQTFNCMIEILIQIHQKLCIFFL